MSTFKVYHTKQWALNTNLHFDENVKNYSPKESDYNLVAYVETKQHDHVFQLTNHIDVPWWENDGVTKVIESRSTSIGDLVENVKTGQLYLCIWAGWKAVLWDIDYFKQSQK